MEKIGDGAANDSHKIRKGRADGDTQEGKSSALSILLWRMRFAMAFQVTPAVEYTGILEFQSSGRRIRPYDCHIKIYQVAVVETRALNGTNAMSIMTC